MKSIPFSLIVLGACLGSLAAAPPRDDLLKLVPPDAGFVVVVQDMRGQLSTVQQSPFVKRFLATEFGKGLSEAAAKPLASLDAEIQKELGQDWTKIRDDILGDAIVFAYRPGPMDRPDDEEGVVLVYARDAAAIAKVIDHVDAAQKKSGFLLSISPETHAGKSYRRRKQKGEADEFQYRSGSLVAIGSSERLMKQVIELETSKPTGESAIGKKLKELKVDTASVVWWLNPRAFDSAIAAKAKAAQGPEATVLATFLKHWHALDGAALFFDPTAEVKVGVALAARPDALPLPTRLFLAELAKPSTLWSAFPEDALAVIAGRFAGPPLLSIGASLMPESAQAEFKQTMKRTLGAALGNDVMNLLPERFGPDWGICIAGPYPESPWPAVTAAVRLTASESDPPIVPRVLDGMTTLGTLAAVGYNAKNPDPITLRSVKQGDVEVRYFENDAGFPTGVKPAYAWKGGYLVLASSPEAVKRFTPPLDNAPITADTPMLRVAFRGWAALLRQRQKDVEGFLVATNGLPATDARRRVEQGLELIGLFDGFDISLRSEANRATIMLRMRASGE